MGAVKNGPTTCRLCGERDEKMSTVWRIAPRVPKERAGGACTRCTKELYEIAMRSGPRDPADEYDIQIDVARGSAMEREIYTRVVPGRDVGTLGRFRPTGSRHTQRGRDLYIGTPWHNDRWLPLGARTGRIVGPARDTIERLYPERRQRPIPPFIADDTEYTTSYEENIEYPLRGGPRPPVVGNVASTVTVAGLDSSIEFEVVRSTLRSGIGIEERLDRWTELIPTRATNTPITDDAQRRAEDYYRRMFPHENVRTRVGRDPCRDAVDGGQMISPEERRRRGFEVIRQAFNDRPPGQTFSETVDRAREAAAPWDVTMREYGRALQEMRDHFFGPIPPPPVVPPTPIDDRTAAVAAPAQFMGQPMTTRLDYEVASCVRGELPWTPERTARYEEMFANAHDRAEEREDERNRSRLMIQEETDD